ncbi:alpha carbonic anhydrase 7-like [Salvia hispanica]|uniref:alpha carbonic anhydrase 7-like n=1 Tax=Salvia hispanica TaxID=49212 RepID=UPI0020094804|nr:alpha carbonic anhydrase 7-like [Salvia hispanica]
MESRITSLYILAPLVISCIVLFCNAQEVEDEREFDYWAKSEKGPRNWGKLKKEWGACNNGNLQSPIDISDKRVKIISKTENTKVYYKVGNAILKNRGHDIQIEWSGGAGSLFINGINYPLRYAHWHSPSEHTINGRRYDMELHLVHLSTNPNLKNRIAVVGILYKIGTPDPILSKIMSNISSIVDNKDDESALGMMDPNDIQIGSERFYRYLGSLTTPPCTEGVIWTLNKKVKTVSRKQVRLLREAVHDYAEENARPLQTRNNRDLYLYGPGDSD